MSYLKTDDKNVAANKIIEDVNLYSNISPEELVNMLGEPQNIEEWEYDTGIGKYPTKTYYYDKHEFMVIDNKVVKLTLYSPKFGSDEGESFSYKKESDIFDMFGIANNDERLKVADTNYALRYQRVSDKIDDLWIPDINPENKTFDTLKITYDYGYFGYLELSPMEQSSIHIACEETIKQILKSPSTAKFPNITKWSIVEGKDGIIVQSYVDSQNGFGAELRSQFQIIIKDGNITSLIFDGAELIAQ